MAWDKDNCTYRTNVYKNSFLSKADRLRGDPDRKKRLKDWKCPFCYYCRNDRIAGQAFTKFACASCGCENWHCNTAVPKLCTQCAAVNCACQECGGDVEFRLILPKPTIRNKKMKALMPAKSPTTTKSEKRRTPRGR